jgi:hypothetical protein
MKFFTKVAGLAAVARLNEEALYAQVHTEIEGGDIRQGLWLKALSDSDGNELKAKAKYAKARVKSLKDEAAIAKAVLAEQEQVSREKKIHEEAYRQKQREENAKERKAKQERESKKRSSGPNGDERVLDIDQAKEFLLQRNYKIKSWADGWEIREPLGGRVRVHSDDELVEYAEGRNNLP